MYTNLFCTPGFSVYCMRACKLSLLFRLLYTLTAECSPQFSFVCIPFSVYGIQWQQSVFSTILFCTSYLSTVCIDCRMCSTPFCSVHLLWLLYTLTTECVEHYSVLAVHPSASTVHTDCRVRSTLFCSSCAPFSVYGIHWLQSLFHTILFCTPLSIYCKH